MARLGKLEVKEQNLLVTLQDFFKILLQKGEIKALLVPQRLPMKNVVMPTLVTDPEKLTAVDCLAPVFPLNAAKAVSRLTRRPIQGPVAVVLRPCEMRAFVELVKLKQGRTDDVIFIVTDCLGAYGNVNYTRFVGPDAAAATLGFTDKALAGQDTACQDFDLSPACKSCEHPLAEKADLQIGLLGLDVKKELLLKANTPKGEELLKKLGLPEGTEPAGRKGAVEALVAKRTAYRDRMFQETGDAVKDLTKLTTYFANCVNCYNCRVACPVCYCKECVFVTDVFDHEPDQYLRWAKRKGILKMPTDTVFFHLTRLAHMSTACIGCGQCSNACPNQIPVMELFRTIAHFTQASFEYEAGRSLEEEPPLSVFREKEFAEVTEGKH